MYRPKTQKRYARTVLLCWFLLGILLGVAVARLAAFTPGVGIVFVLGTASLVVAPKRSLLAIYVLFLFGGVLGINRGQAMQQRVAPYARLAGHTVTIEVVADSSAVYNATSQLDFDASHVQVVAPYRAVLPGRMEVAGFGSNSVLRGDKVKVSGKLFLKRGGKQAGISFGQITMLSRSSSPIEGLRRNFLAGLATALPEPHDQFAAGLLIGQRSEIPKYVGDTLQIVGLSHVIAVSGYNLTILVEVSRKRLGKRSKFRGTLFSLLLVAVFVALAGSSASIARAAFVSVLGIITAHYGRSVKPVLLLLLAAAFTAYANPLNVWSDIGWYLSFLAFFGVLVLAPLLQKRYFTREPGMVAGVLLETTAAQLLTLPVMLFVFGQLSLVALLANIVVVPLVPLAMLCSLVAGVAGMLVPFYSGIAAWPAKVLLGFMLQASSLLARIPHAMVQVPITAGFMAVLYAGVAFLCLLLYKKQGRAAKIGLK